MKFSALQKQVKIGSIDLKKTTSSNLMNNYNSSQQYEEIDYNSGSLINDFSQYDVDSFYTSSPKYNMEFSFENVDGKIKKLLGCDEFSIINASKELIDLSNLENSVLIVNNLYGEFRNMLTDNIQNMGSLNSFVPQGVCNVNGYTLVSCYQKDGKPSILIMDKSGNKRWVALDLKKGTHVGGIAYDSINNNIWVTGADGEICLYSYQSIINNNGYMVAPDKTFATDITNSNNSKVASYMTYYDGKIYVGSFNKDSNGMIKEYKIGSDGKTLEYVKKFDAPAKAQGISFIKKNGKEYMCVACSYGRKNNSHLKIFEYDQNQYIEKKDIPMPPMLEQVTFNQDGTLKCVFESNAREYSDADIKIPAVCSLNISKYI